MTARAERPFCLAVSGGSTPWTMLRMLASEDVPWHRVHLFQVDERIVPAFDPARNFTKIQSNLLESVPIPANQIHPMPVEIPDLNTAAATYAETLRQFAGTPPILDLVHLGLGADGHTASLVPGDPVLGCTSDVAVTNPYHGYRRMTLTYPVFDHARRILWIVTGSEKANALEQLRHGDQTIPASRIPTNNALVLADADAAGQLH
jgi:6-phosphogluconolactonase